MAELVVDASLALKWELDDEEFVQEAVAIRDAHLVEQKLQLIAPGLFLYEVVNGLTVAVRRLRIDSERGAQMLRRLFAVGISLRQPNPGRIYEIATQYGLSGYDSAYVALAEAGQVEFWTADRRLFDAVSGDLKLTRWIGDWPA